MVDDAWTFKKVKKELFDSYRFAETSGTRTWVTGIQRRSQQMVLHQSSTMASTMVMYRIYWALVGLESGVSVIHVWRAFTNDCFASGFPMVSKTFSVNFCNQKLICHWVEAGASQVPLLLAFLNPKKACWNDLDLSWAAEEVGCLWPTRRAVRKTTSLFQLSGTLQIWAETLGFHRESDW